MKKSLIIAIALFSSSFSNATPAGAPFSQSGNLPFFPDLGRNIGLQGLGAGIPKIGAIIEGNNLIWGESIGWVNLKTAHGELKIGSNILAGWIWLENCGWVCLGNGHPLEGRRYSNRGASDWGINNDGKGNLSGYAWSEVTGWISFRTGHSHAYLHSSGQFYGYAWGENVGWMHLGPGRRVRYLTKADPGPWKKIGPEPASRFAGRRDDSEMSSGSIPAVCVNINHEKYDEDADSVCVLRLGRDDFCTHTRRHDTPVYIIDLAKLSPIRAPPVIV
ncbi:MAG: hypothetical protein NTZ78_08865 [Candidatus Aureabacteria bacterium]|nr:hypothetical protein [Candidatus Auribacterota bacterium]